MHYRVTAATNRAIGKNELFLIDSGAQYEDGTTDITRTVVVGTPSDEMRDRFTRVLKGHIAIASAVFPEGTSGAQLDSLARVALWQAGLDFDHGTGHGVGSYLSVHEGPARISKLGTVPLKRGMILSNEPGYYKTGAYGIRIENLVLVVAAPAPDGAEKPLECIRDADAGADRPAADRHPHADRQGTRLDRQLSCARARDDRAAGRSGDASLARSRRAGVSPSVPTRLPSCERLGIHASADAALDPPFGDEVSPATKSASATRLRSAPGRRASWPRRASSRRRGRRRR